MILRSGSASDTGRVRPTNQDLSLEEPRLYAVADGMGGHAGGGVASRMAVETLRATFVHDQSLNGLRAAINEANVAVWRQSQVQPDLHGMGTTLTTAAVVTANDGREILAVANVGDSRTYLYSSGRILQVTSDHSLAEEKVRQGEMTEAEAATHPQRHILTRALGIATAVDVDLWELSVQVGDRILLCSDGLTNEVRDEEIAHVLQSISTPHAASLRLVQTANDRGGHDNVTVVVIEVLGTDSGSILPPPPRGERMHARKEKKQRRFTFRVFLFFLGMIAVVALGFGFIDWYGTQNWYVTIKGYNLVIYQGRPGGVLWENPKLVDRTNVTTGQVLPTHLSTLEKDVNETSLSAAKNYVADLYNEYLTDLGAGHNLGTPTTPTLPHITTTTYIPPAPPAPLVPVAPAVIATTTTTRSTSTTVLASTTTKGKASSGKKA